MTSALAYPFTLAHIYPAVYPHLVLYPILVPQIRRPTAQAKTCTGEVRLPYPFNLASLYATVYPHITLYPSLPLRIARPTQECSIAIDCASLHYPSSLSIYKPLYPHVLPYPPVLRTVSAPRPNRPSSLLLSAPSQPCLTPIASPFRLPSASLMDRLALEDDERVPGLQFPLYRPEALWPTFSEKTLVGVDLLARQKSLQDHMLESPVESEGSDGASSDADAFHVEHAADSSDGSERDQTFDLDDVSNFLAETRTGLPTTPLSPKWHTAARFVFEDHSETVCSRLVGRSLLKLNRLERLLNMSLRCSTPPLRRREPSTLSGIYTRCLS
jgi:hypothetical protein